MARGSNATATEEVEEEQTTMFKELDDANPDQKELRKRARKYAKEKVARDALLKENKEQVDGFMDRLLEQMHKCGIKKFKEDSIIFEQSAGREKVKLKIDTTTDEDDADGEDEDGEGDDAE